MNPEVNEEIKELKHEIKELKSVLMHIIEQMDNGTPLHSNSTIIKICRAELGIKNK
jgi:hypothetical protein